MSCPLLIFSSFGPQRDMKNEMVVDPKKEKKGSIMSFEDLENFWFFFNWSRTFFVEIKVAHYTQVGKRGTKKSLLILYGVKLSDILKA